jgi:hypothetical protein
MYHHKGDYHPYDRDSVNREAQSAAHSVWLRAGRPGDRGSIPGSDKRTFPLASVSRLTLGPTPPPVQWVRGGPFPRRKARLGRDADHSPPSSIDVELELYLLFPKAFHGVEWDLFFFMIETVSTSVNFYQTTQRNIPKESHLHTRHRENLKFHPV